MSEHHQPVRCPGCRGRIADAGDLLDHAECMREMHRETEPNLEPKDPRT